MGVGGEDERIVPKFVHRVVNFGDEIPKRVGVL